MPLQDWFVLMGVGGLFILLGIATVIWGRSEERGYYDSLSTRSDLREFLEHQPVSPQPVALKIGGWIAIAIGLTILAAGGVIFLILV